MVKISKQTSIKIFYDRIDDKRFLAFDLFIYPIGNILKNIYQNVKFISNFNDLRADENILLIMYLNDLGKYVKKYGFNISSNIRIIFIHADFLYNHSRFDQNEIINFVNKINYNKCFIWEYSSQNIFYYNKFYPNIKYKFLPLLYDKYIEDLYTSKLDRGKIPWEEKDIDVVFMGDYSDRRKPYYEEIKKRYKTHIITGNNNYSEMFNLIERSKIFVNLFSKESNKAFDYFRLALLYSNSVFVITETPKVDFKIETNLSELKDVIITCEANNCLDKIATYVKLPGEDIDKITLRVYENFKKYTLEQSILDFFEI
jgi:hypothetical protein